MRNAHLRFPERTKTNIFMETVMHIQYLEIVKTDVETACTLYSKMHGVSFSDADHNLGGARTARLANGGTLGVRAPMHDAERPVVRPYILVKDTNLHGRGSGMHQYAICSR